MSQQVPDQPTTTRMPADVDAPDKIVYGLTFRQLAILAITGMLIYALFTSLHQQVPFPVLLGAAVLLAGIGFGVAVGRRDGLALDIWLAHGLRCTRAAKALTTTGTPAVVPDWVHVARRQRMPLPAPLRLPAETIAEDGEIRVSGGRVAVVACTTVNLSLRTPAEQNALVDGFGQWLNALSTPTQIVVSAQPVDLHHRARHLADTATTLAHPALQQACTDHADFLAQLAQQRDPLHRHVMLVTRTTGGEHTARRRADDTARALAGLGVTTRSLDAAATTTALAAAADPYRLIPADRLASNDSVITTTPRAEQED